MKLPSWSKISTGARLGCILYSVIGGLTVSYLLLIAALGDCAPNEDGSGCENDELIKLAMFPGSLMVFVLLGLLTAWTVTRDKK